MNFNYFFMEINFNYNISYKIINTYYVIHYEL